MAGNHVGGFPRGCSCRDGTEPCQASCIYVAPLQVDMLLGIDFLHENGVELNSSTGDLSVGASKVPMLKANSPSGLREDICTPGPPYGCERPV